MLKARAAGKMRFLIKDTIILTLINIFKGVKVGIPPRLEKFVTSFCVDVKIDVLLRTSPPPLRLDDV